MGLSTAQGRILLLLQRNSEVSQEKQAADISQQRIALSQLFASESTAIENQYGQGNAENLTPEQKEQMQAEIDALMEKLQAADNKLMQELNMTETQKQALMKELESVKSVMDGNVEQSFKSFDA